MTLRLRTAHTADLDPADLRAVRALLDEAFDGDFGDQDWDHGLGGMHALVHDGAGLAAHGSVVMRRIRHRGRWLRTGYVEAVAVRADVRRSGLGGRVMAELERMVDRAYELGALSASEDGAPLYTAGAGSGGAGRCTPSRPTGSCGCRRRRGACMCGPGSPGCSTPVTSWSSTGGTETSPE